MKRLLVILSFLVVLIAEAAPENQKSRKVVIINRIEGLDWQPGVATEAATTGGEAAKVHLSMQGRFVRPGWTLMLFTAPVPVGADGLVSVEVNLPSSATSFELLALGPDGSVETQTIGVLSEGDEKNIVSLSAGMREEDPIDLYEFRDRALSLGLSYDNIGITQTGISDVVLGTLYARVGFTTPLWDPRFSLAVNLGGNLFHLSSPPAGLDVRFREGTVRLGWKWIDSPEDTVVVNFGFGYYTMSVSLEAFGYQNATVEGLGIDWRRLLGHRLRGRVGGGFYLLNSPFGLANRRLEFKLGVDYLLTPRQELGLGLNYHQLKISDYPRALTQSSVIFAVNYSYLF